MTHSVEHLSMVSSWSVVYLLWRKVSVQILCLIFKMVIWFFVVLIVVRVLYSGYRTLIRHMIRSSFCLFFFLVEKDGGWAQSRRKKGCGFTIAVHCGIMGGTWC